MRDAVDKGWSEVFGEAVSRAPGIHVIRDAPNLEHRILLLRLGDGLTIVAPSGIDIPTDLTPDEAFTHDFASSLAPGRVLGPSLHHYADRSSFVPQEPCDARQVDGADGFDTNVDEAEWSEGGFGHERGSGDLWYACFDGDERVAMGNMTNFNGAPGDVGLVTRPDRRGKGYGARLASAMCVDAFESMDVLRYRALDTNIASLAVARKLGFVQDGANLVVRLDEVP